MNDDKPKCKLCETMSGVFGILLGTVILLISVDLLIGGRISSLISGGHVETEAEEITE